MISQWFKIKARWRFCINYLCNSQDSEERGTNKSNFVGIFQIFETFEYLEISFSTNVNKSFLTVINIAKVTLPFCQNLDKYKAELKHTVEMPWHSMLCDMC